MRPLVPAFILAAAFLTAPVSRSQTVEPSKAKAPAEDAPTTAAAAPAWEIRRFTLSKNGAEVTVDEVGTRKSATLKSTTTKGDRLLSAAFTAESGELRVEAVIGGTHHSLVQKAAELDKPVSRGPTGPTEEDREKYKALSEKARERFREELRSHFEDPKFRNAPVEDRRAVIRSLFEKMSKEPGDTTTAPKGADLDPSADSPAPKESVQPAADSPPAKSQEERQKYESLSEKARDKFRDAVREKFSDQTFRNASEEERRNAVRAIFEKIEKEDQEGR